MPADLLVPFDAADLAMMEADCAAVLAAPYDVTVHLSADAGRSAEERRAARDRLQRARVLHENAPSLVARLLAQLRAAQEVRTAALAYHAAERARTRNEDPAAEERLDADMASAWQGLRDALDLGDDCEACGAGDNEPCAPACPCRAEREGCGGEQCSSCAGGTENYEEVARG